MYEAYFYHPETGDVRKASSPEESSVLLDDGFKMISYTDYLRFRKAIDYAMAAIGATPRTSGPMSMRTSNAAECGDTPYEWGYDGEG